MTFCKFGKNAIVNPFHARSVSKAWEPEKQQTENESRGMLGGGLPHESVDVIQHVMCFVDRSQMYIPITRLLRSNNHRAQD